MTIRYHKAKHGGIIKTVTNCPDTERKLRRFTNKPDPNGYIFRESMGEAYQDKNP